MQRNIGGKSNDKNWRYQMPQLITKEEGRGNGQRTRLINMTDVAKHLHRHPAYPTKFFSLELGVLCTINDADSEYVINGTHSVAKLDRLLDLFIQKFVLCPKCKLPESDLSVVQKKIVSTCNSCGHIANLDAKHRIANFICKIPPRETDKIKIRATNNSSQRREDILAEDAEGIRIEDYDDIHWETDVSDAAVQKRRQEAENLAALVQSPLPASVDVPNTCECATEQFASILKDESMDVSQKFKLLQAIQQREKIGNIQRTKLIFNALITENILLELGKYKEILAQATTDERTQKAMLVALEALLEKHQELLPNLLDILMGFYEYEIVSEAVLMSFFTKKRPPNPFRTRLTKAAAPFIEWLSQEETDEEEDEEEKVELLVDASKTSSNSRASIISSLLTNLQVSSSAGDLDAL